MIKKNEKGSFNGSNGGSNAFIGGRLFIIGRHSSIGHGFRNDNGEQLRNGRIEKRRIGRQGIGR